MLRTLYYETELFLTGGFSEVNRAQRVAIAQAELRDALKDWSAGELDTYLTRHYPAYWLKVDLPHKVAHAHFLREAWNSGKTLATQVSFDAARGVTVVLVTHQRHLLRRADHILVLHDGTVRMFGRRDQVFLATKGSAVPE